MEMVHVLTTDWGNITAPDDMVAINQAIKELTGPWGIYWPWNWSKLQDLHRKFNARLREETLKLSVARGI